MPYNTFVITKNWRNIKPPPGSQINFGHPLAQGLVGCWLMNEGGGRRIADLASLNSLNFSVSSDVWGLTKRGFVAFNNAVTASGGFHTNTARFIPTKNVTIVINKFKTDTTNRASSGFGVLNSDLGTSRRCGAHLPWSDGIVYWDFGGATGSNRISKSGLTFGDDIWAFSAGDKGMKMYQNSILWASSTTSITRGTTNAIDFYIGNGNNDAALYSTDICKFGFCYFYNRILLPSEVRDLSFAPYQFIQPRVYRFYSVPAGVSANVLTRRRVFLSCS